MGKEFEKEKIYEYVKLNHFAVHLKLTEHCKLTILQFRTSIWSSSPISGYMSKRNENRISKRYLHSHVYASIIHNSQDMETTQMPIKEWIDKENVI